MKSLKITVNFLARIIYNFRKTDIFTRSGSLAFTILLSFVPFIISMTSIISQLPLSSYHIRKMQNHLFTNYIPPNSSKQFVHLIRAFVQHSHNLSILGFISLLVTTYLMIFAIEKQLNATWHIKKHRHFCKAFIIYTTFLLCGPLLSCTVSVFKIYSTLLFSSTIISILDRCIGYLTAITFFFLVYKMLPKHKVKKRYALTAAIIATIIFNLTQELFIHFLVKIFVNYNIIYGSLSFIPILLIWIYFSCLNLFFCAGIIYALETKFNRQIQHYINNYFYNLFTFSKKIKANRTVNILSYKRVKNV